MIAPATPRVVHRTAHLRLRLTRRQARRCYRLLRSAGDVWAWLVDCNRQRYQQGEPPVAGYQALCRELTKTDSFGELSTVGARSVLKRYSDAWFQAAKRHQAGQQRAGFPRRKRGMVPVRCYYGTFILDGTRVRLPVASGRPALWVRLARPLPYPPEQVRAVTLLADGGRLWLAVTAAVPIQHHDLDPGRIAGVDLGIIHPYAVVTEQAGLLISGRAIRAENYLHLQDQQARRAKAARRAPTPGRRGSRRWRRHRARLRQVEARHRRRVHQTQHEAAKQVIAFAIQQHVGILVVGDPKGITNHDAGRVQNLRLRQWRRTHLLQALHDKAEQAGMVVRLVDERGTSSTCPTCHQRVPKPTGRRFSCPSCRLQGHRDLVGAANIAAKAGGGPTSAGVPTLVEHRRAGTVPDGVTDAATCTTSGGIVGSAWPRATHPTTRCRVGVARCASPTWRLARIKQRRPTGQTLPEGALVRVPWSGFDLINAINAWKRSEAAGRMFVAAPGGAIAKHVMGLAWRHEVSAQVFEEAAVDLGRALSAYAHARGKGERQVGSHDVSARATAGIASGCETRPTQSGWAAAIHAQ